MALWKNIFNEKIREDPYRVPVVAFTMSIPEEGRWTGISGFNLPKSQGFITCEYCGTEYPETTEHIKCVSCGAPLKRTLHRVILPPPGIVTVPSREVLK